MNLIEALSSRKRVIKYLKRPWLFVRYCQLTRLCGEYGKKLSDEEYLKRNYRLRMGKKLNIDNPKSFSEKLQWLKLHNRNPLYTKLVDKYEVKKYVSELIGDEYVIKNYGVWEHFNDIPFEDLPEQFVIKCTHDCGGLVICKDKSSFKKEEAKAKIEKSLKRNYFWLGREWPYKNVKPRIVVEQYMEDEKTAELRDYKFFCFDGQVKAMFIATDRQKAGEEVKFDFFDTDFNHLPVKQGHDNALVTPEKPSQFEKMKELAAILSSGIPHVRVDFYEVNGRIYFGEMTFFHFGGVTPFVPEEWDYKFGDWLKLPSVEAKQDRSNL